MYIANTHLCSNHYQVNKTCPRTLQRTFVLDFLCMCIYLLYCTIGATLGEVSSVVTCDGMNFVHLEMLRSVNGTAELPVDPTPFLQPILEPTIRVNLDCNSVAVLESGNVVDRMAVTGTDPERVLLGEPLITDLRILPHEFPQPADYVLRGTGSYASSSPVTFTTQSTSIMVGPNVVNFGKFTWYA